MTLCELAMARSDAAAPCSDAEPPTHSTFAVSRCRLGELALEDDEIAEEVPVALEYNGISHAVMLASPADLEDFALGFSLSEGLVASPRDVYEIDTEVRPEGIAVKLRIAAQAFAALKDRRRAMAGRTGCGLCGTESLQEVMRAPAPVSSSASFSDEVLYAAFAQLQTRQELLRHTGSTHAAAWLRADGQVALVREDVGRHNALDKLIGALARGGEDRSRGAVLVTSRASYEMVLKTASAGVGMLAAVSGPTALAVRLAIDAGVTLAGFVRAGRHVVYSHPQRLHSRTEQA
ncbi:formate dehydrogenase accessory sulfurtransferase FdhD [Cupriavidus sp. D39]|uniref:formate dehydrogenase accessory sulfurtransferase FdhD n=1 Tax=Cupriavidus sp. D39 TaxID=2997877 RepID=UPI00226F4E6C|nr:formate dehydrogenase accessory sulfurtransferase FdhD [Cupriavidus sp. D39]MCY0857948.1 formate dehydrogenase accessory sulfurtransferase FdhD [Cupriavidus sp. D39]